MHVVQVRRVMRFPSFASLMPQPLSLLRRAKKRHVENLPQGTVLGAAVALIPLRNFVQPLGETEKVELLGRQQVLGNHRLVNFHCLELPEERHVVLSTHKRGAPSIYIRAETRNGPGFSELVSSRVAAEALQRAQIRDIAPPQDGTNLGFFECPLGLHDHHDRHPDHGELRGHDVTGVRLLLYGVAQEPQELGDLTIHSHLVVGADACRYLEVSRGARRNASAACGLHDVQVRAVVVESRPISSRSDLGKWGPGRRFQARAPKLHYRRADSRHLRARKAARCTTQTPITLRIKCETEAKKPRIASGVRGSWLRECYVLPLARCALPWVRVIQSVHV